MAGDVNLDLLETGVVLGVEEDTSIRIEVAGKAMDAVALTCCRYSHTPRWQGNHTWRPPRLPYLALDHAA